MQHYEGLWSGVYIVHRPSYQTTFGETTVPGPLIVKRTVEYAALVQQVELLSGGELTQGSARCLANRGWGLLININESLRFLTQLKCDEANRKIDAKEPSRSSSVVDFSIRAKQLRSMNWRKGLAPEMMELRCISMQNLLFGHRIAMLEFCSGCLFVLLLATRAASATGATGPAGCAQDAEADQTRA